MDTNMDVWRITLLGDGGVGKTALAIQFAMNHFIVKGFTTTMLVILTLPSVVFQSQSNEKLEITSLQTYDPTVEDAYRCLTTIDDRKCSVELIDTAGQEEYSTFREQWVKDAQAFVVVYSITSRATFDRLTIFWQNIIRIKRDKPLVTLVGNKCDQISEREISREEGGAMARQFGADFMEVSAKAKTNVQRVFHDLVRNLRRRREGPIPDLTLKEKSKSCCVIL